MAVRCAALWFSIVTPLYCFRRKEERSCDLVTWHWRQAYVRLTSHYTVSESPAGTEYQPITSFGQLWRPITSFGQFWRGGGGAIMCEYQTPSSHYIYQIWCRDLCLLPNLLRIVDLVDKYLTLLLKFADQHKTHLLMKVKLHCGCFILFRVGGQVAGKA